MNYHQTIEYLYSKLPMFQNLGVKAIKPKLDNIKKLCDALGNPQNKLRCLHVAGTNGKGSSSHFLASILQESGYKVGLYTSPHLKDFRERFRINGQEMPKAYVMAFVTDNQELINLIRPSFFELTVALALKYFAEEKVDFAIIEVGLGGRFDSTNIIHPLVSLITNIGLDHTDILGDTLSKIAYEKAGIIKDNTPVIISEFNENTAEIFKEEAIKKSAYISFATDFYEILNLQSDIISLYITIKNKIDNGIFSLSSGLIGEYQAQNILGVLKTFDVLINEYKLKISKENIYNGIANVVTNTNLKGRWQILQKKPLVICDTGHNAHAFALTITKLKNLDYSKLFLILGFVKDKDVKTALSFFPTDAEYFFCEFDSPRRLPVEDLEEIILDKNLKAHFSKNVNQAIIAAQNLASSDDIIFIGGSTYLVAEINNL